MPESRRTAHWVSETHCRGIAISHKGLLLLRSPGVVKSLIGSTRTERAARPLPLLDLKQALLVQPRPEQQQQTHWLDFSVVLEPVLLDSLVRLRQGGHPDSRVVIFCKDFNQFPQEFSRGRMPHRTVRENVRG